MPICLFLVVFQVAVLRSSITDAPTVFLGLLLTFVGLMLFIQGLRLGLMPLAEGVGALLPQRSRLPLILLFWSFLRPYVPEARRRRSATPTATAPAMSAAATATDTNSKLPAIKLSTSSP